MKITYNGPTEKIIKLGNLSHGDHFIKHNPSEPPPGSDVYRRVNNCGIPEITVLNVQDGGITRLSPDTLVIPVEAELIWQIK